ncbi:MAG TPA: insulinase family protein [Phycisphaerales bacterium]|nr:insulinase family protein [Phycisphaerales bacterium]
MKPIKHLHVSSVAVILIFAAFCFGMSNPVKPDVSTTADRLFDYQLITLDNGMRVITVEDFSAPIAAVQVWYEVGSKDEQSDRQGYAHMFEHMMFKGTDRVSADGHFNTIRKVGGTCNAYTSFDQTVYIQTLPAHELELALWLEAERMAFLKIDQDNVDTERKVVEEELRMGENRPYGTLFKKIYGELFTQHPYRWTPIGNIAHLRATSVADLRAFWNRYYLPNNATLVIVGAVKHQDARQMAERYFGWIPAGPQPPRVSIEEPRPSIARTIVIDDENAPAGRVMMVWRTVPTGHPDETALDFLSEILGGGKSSRVYRRLVAEQQLAVEAGSWSQTLQQAGLFSIYATLSPTSEDYETVLAGLSEQLERIQQHGVTEDELEKARNQLLRNVVTATLSVESKARLIGTAAVTMGDVSRVNRLLDDIRAVTADDVRRVADEWLGKDRVFRFIVKKNEDGMLSARLDNDAAPITAEPERVSPPPGRPGVERPNDFPKTPPFAQSDPQIFDLPYRETTLGNRLKVLTVSNHKTPFVSVMLGLPNGAWTEHKPGLAAMTLEMLTRGTENYTEAELARKLDHYAVTLNGAADKDNATVSMSALTEHLEQGMDLMAEVVLKPTFAQDEFEKLLAQEITDLTIRRQDPRYVAETWFYKAVFGDHPYSRPIKGTPPQLERISSDDLKLWWRKFARPDQAALIFAGDITPRQAAALARKYFGQWETELVETGLILADIPQPGPNHILLVDRPGSAQAQLRVGHLGITRDQQPDYFYTLMAANYFGGSFNSRLNENIRVKRGLTYGAQGWFGALRMAGTFEISTFTRNESVMETLEVIFEQIAEFRTVAPTETEFNDTRSYLLGSFARNRETPQQIARDLWLIESQRLGRDYFKKLFGAIEAATPNDCIRITQKIVKPDKLTIVVVGDAAVLKERLETIAPVEIVQP